MPRLRPSPRSLLPAVLAVALDAGTVRAQNPAVTIAVDAAAQPHVISDGVYGIAYGDAATLADLKSPLNRLGGNNTSRYNWQINADNRGADWYFESVPYGSSVAGEVGDSFVSISKGAGAEPMLTVPMVGWVAKLGTNRAKLSSFSIAKYGAQTGNDWQWFPDAGNGVRPSGQYVTGNDPGDANIPADGVFQQGYIQYLVTRWGPAGSGGLRYYILDNEPSIWHSTHRDVHPTGATMDEVKDKLVDYAARIKAADPTALVVGPEEWGWSGYLFSGYDQQWASQHGWSNLPDRNAHGGWDYLPWLLDQMRQRQVATGQRLLDVFSVHYYPQGGEFGDDVSPAMQLRRNRSTRSLWDPSYVDETWINDVVRLIPRLKQWVASHYPGTPTAITEYNWGAEGHINGATTQADILGIFGREGLDLAARWTTPDPSTPTYKAIKMYRNYDGAGGRFGETGVSAIVPNPDNVSAFAARRAGDAALTVMVISKYLSGNTTATVNIAGFAVAGTAQAWRLTSSNAITRLADLSFGGSSFSAVLPPQSVTLFVVRGGGTPATADLSISNTDGRTTASPGQSLTYTITASNAGPAPVTGAAVVDTLPASLVGATWSCAGAAGGTCAASGTGNIGDVANLPVGGSVTYTLNANVTANPLSLVNTASIAVPGGATDPNPANNSRTDVDILVCAGDVILVPDGRAITRTIAAGATAWFAARLRIGASYSVEFKNRMTTGSPGVLTVFRGDDGCLGTSTLATHDTAANDPSSGASAARASFTAAGSDRLHRMRLFNSSGSPVALAVGLAETTLFSPAWSTNGGFDTYYSLANTSTSAVRGTLVLLDPAGAVLTSLPITVPPTQTASANTQALGVSRGRTGAARFTHDGPPGAIIAEAAIARFSTSPAYVRPVKFQPVREAR